MGDYPFVLPSGGVALPVSVANGGTGQATAAAGYSALSPMTTAGDMEYEVAAGTAARLPVGSAGQVLGVSGGEPAWLAGMTQQSTTGVNGYALVNGTGTILSWSAPNDGQMHTAMIIGIVGVTSAETGGQVNVQYTDMTGSAQNFVLVASGQAVGSVAFNNGLNRTMILLPAGSTLAVVQSAALTAGTAKVWAEIWGS
jgi:hypothetical protein